MGESFTDDIILIEDRYTFNFSDCTITNLRDLAENGSFKAACDILPQPKITYTDTSDRIEIAAGDKQTVIHIYGYRIDLIYVYDEPQVEEHGLFAQVKEIRARSFFKAFRKRLMEKDILEFGPPTERPIAAEPLGSKEGRHTPGHHVYTIDFT